MKKKLLLIKRLVCSLSVVGSALIPTSIFGAIDFNNKISDPVDKSMATTEFLILNSGEKLQDIKISLLLKNATLEQFIKELQKQCAGKAFLNYSVSEINDNKADITIDFKEVTLENALNSVLRLRGLTFTQQGNMFVIIKTPVVVQKNITFKVVDIKDNPVVGATVLVRGTQKGAVSETDGTCKLTNVKTGDIIDIMFIGYQKRTVTVTSETNSFKVVLQEEIYALDNIVVTGFRTYSNNEFTGAQTTIKKDDLEKIGSTNIAEMLEGKSSGLMITTLSSTPGAASKVRVRSGATFMGSREPLWVVDGVIYNDPVPLTSEEINSFDQVNLIGNAISGINPEDISSINILKDASATALYGTQAANGVIVITTKRGKEGSVSLNYSGSSTIVDRPRYSNFDLMNSKERVDVSREIYQRLLPYPEEISEYVGYEKALREYLAGNINHSQFNDQVASIETMNTDWFNEYYRLSVTQSHNLSLSGGSDKMRFYYSLGYNGQPGAEKAVNVDRITTRANIDVDLRKNILIQVGISGSVQKSNYTHPMVGSAFDKASYTSRTFPARDENGDMFYVKKLMSSYKTNNFYGKYNYQNELDNSSYNITNKDLAINTSLVWNIIKGIRLSGDFSYRTTSTSNEQWITENTYAVAKLRTYDGVEDKIDEYVNRNSMLPFGGLYSAGITNQDSWAGKAQLNIARIIAKDHVFNLNIGGSFNSAIYKGSTGWSAPGYNHFQGRSFIPLPNVMFNTSSELNNYGYTNMLKWLTTQGNSVYPKIDDQEKNTVGMFAILNYSYLEKYVINCNIRSDGSNTFGQYERYKFRPVWSLAGRWNLHYEEFLADFKPLDELALRVSYGFRGTSPTGSPYLILNKYQYDSTFGENTATISTFPNANLTWERTSTFNAGINHSWFGGRLSGSFDFSYSHGKDLLLSRPVSLVNGQTTQLYNGGSKEDFSYEADLRAVLLRSRNFGWSVSGNATFTKENVLKGYESQTLSVSDYLGGSIYLAGFPVDAFYSYQFDGLNNLGEPKFKNLESTGTIAEYFRNVLTYSGRRSPTVYGGFGTEFKYKDFTAGFRFSYKLGHHVRLLKLYNGTQNMPLPDENMNSIFNERWRKPGDEEFTNIPALSSESMVVGTSTSKYPVTYRSIVPNASTTAWFMYDMSDIRVVKGDFIRLQSITLGYTLKKAWLKPFGIGSARLTGQIANPFVWAFDKRLRGQDPEQVQSLGMPALPRYSFSLSVEF